MTTSTPETRSLDEFELRTLPGLNQRAAQNSRQLRFLPDTYVAVDEWQGLLRAKIWQLLGVQPGLPIGDLTAETIEHTAGDDFDTTLIVLQTEPGEFLPCYVLTPHQVAPPYKPVIALHGHGTWGAKSLIGIAPNQLDGTAGDVHRGDFARQLALDGFCVFAPLLRGFGERMEDEQRNILRHNPRPETGLSSCERLSTNALLSGTTLTGLRMWDVMRLIGYIKSLPNLVPDVLSCVGMSGGGTLALYTAALDLRITCAVISGALNTFQDSLMTIRHCMCNTIPHIFTYADMGDIAGLIAPRPLLIEAGHDDPIYPVAGVERAMHILRPIYEQIDVSDRLEAFIFDGGHRYDGGQTAAWLSRWLI